MKLIANLVAEQGGRTVPLHPTLEVTMGGGAPVNTPDYIPGGGQVSIVSASPQDGSIVMSMPGMDQLKGDNQILAVEVSTKPFINLVWLGSVIMLVSVFLVVIRRSGDVARDQAAA